MRPVRFLGLSDTASIAAALREIEAASFEDAMVIADGYTVANHTTTRNLDATAATVTDLANFVATFIDDLKRRGQNRVE